MSFNLLCIALFSAFGLHLGIQKIFTHYKQFDDINHRSSHKTLATRTGGIAIFFNLTIITLYFYVNNIILFDYSLFIPLGIMFTVGVYDDIYKADFKLKFILQIITAKILIDMGFVIDNFHGLFGLFEVPWILAQLTTVFVFVIVVNAINFIDGIDGLAITQILTFIFFVELFSIHETPLYNLGLLSIISFLPLYFFNFKKDKKIFLGDSGSLLIGTLAVIYCFYVLGENYLFAPNIKLNKTLYSVILLLYPLVDLLRVFIIRLYNGLSPFYPDKNHIHHLILKNTNSHIKTLMLIFLINTLPLILLFIYSS